MNKTLEDYKDEAERKGQDIAEQLSKALNSMTYDKEVIEGFVRGITNQHRTLQQSSMRAIYALLMEWAPIFNCLRDYKAEKKVFREVCRF